jgi:hypothetical protein
MGAQLKRNALDCMATLSPRGSPAYVQMDPKVSVANRDGLLLKRIKEVLAASVVATIVVISVLLNLLPWHPRTLIGWLLFIALGVPAYIVAEGAAKWLMFQVESRGPGRVVHERTAKQTFSWLRIMWALFVALLLGGIAAALFVAAESILR